MKGLSYKVNIIKDSNKIIGSTETDFEVVRPGSFIRIGNDSVLYNVAKTNKIFYIKDFLYAGDKKITIKDNVSFNIIKGDVLDISYKEYELFTLFGIKNKGSNYKVGDMVYVYGGVLAVESQHNLTRPITFEVTEIDQYGGVNTLGLKDIGLYIVTPDKVAQTYTHGGGNGLELELEYKTKDDRKIIERIVQFVDGDTVDTDLYLDFPLPEGLKEGKLSLTKWEILLASNYVGDTRTEIECEICRDFTPYLGLPILQPGQFNLNLGINQGFSLIDQYYQGTDNELKEIRDKMKELEEKLNSIITSKN